MTLTVFWSVLTVMVVLATAVLVVPLFWSQRAPDDASQRRRQRLALGAAVLGVPITSLGIYSMLGSPQLVRSTAVAGPVVMDRERLPHPGARALSAGEKAIDLAQATKRLEQRLAASPDDPEGWRLLAQAYRFAGREADALRAESRADARGAAAVASVGEVPPTPAPVDIGTARARVAAAPRDRDAWAALAEGLRRQRDFRGALEAFERRAALGAMTADLWADYADAHGASMGRLDETSAKYIAAALRINPQHPKALWLLGSYQTERADYRAAIATWDKLAALLPTDSSDARIIAANRAEATAALARAADPAAAPAGKVAVRGEVVLPAQWRGEVPRGATLFVVAKSADDPGPPLAVYRTPADAMPVRFTLDDSLAMLPTRTLSGSRSVIVEARISASGRAEPQPGDLRAISGRIDPRSAGAVRLIISERIG